MVDLGGIVDACAAVTPSAAEVKEALSNAVVYQVRGRSHANSSGLSVYYPLSVQNSKELTAFQTIAANPSYVSFVDKMAHGATYSGGSQSSLYSSYSDSSWYDSNGQWSFAMDEDTILALLGAVASMRSPDPRWEYVDEHDGESKVVTFAAEPQVDDAGVYWMQLDEDGVNNVAAVGGLVYRQEEDGATVELGETYEVYADWDEGEDQGVVEDGFDGKWLSLPDGQNLCLYVVESSVDEATFTAPIRLNGEDCYLRLRQDLESGAVEVEGVWHGAGDGGLVDRGDAELVAGDVIVPLYGTDGEVAGSEYTVPAEGLSVDFGELPVGSYQYSFNITDVFGDNYVTDPVQFDVEEDGIYFVA